MLLPAALITFAVGILDDARGLSATQKIVGQIISSVLLIASGSSIMFFGLFSSSVYQPDYCFNIQMDSYHILSVGYYKFDKLNR